MQTALEQILHDITTLESQLGRRSFLKAASLLVVAPSISLDKDDNHFLQKVAATLLPLKALESTGINVAENVERLLRNGSADHRKKVIRFLTWSQRASILYGGDKVAINARGSRYILVRKMGRTLSSLCLIAFWGDERALDLINEPGAPARD